MMGIVAVSPRPLPRGFRPVRSVVEPPHPHLTPGGIGHNDVMTLAGSPQNASMVAVRRLEHSDTAALGRLLDQDPVATVYLRSELRLNIGSGAFWGVVTGDEIRAAVLGGPLVVPWIPDPGDAPRLAAALASQSVPRMMVGPRASIHALRAEMRPRRRPRQLRDPQPVLVLHATDAPAVVPRPPVRRATRGDLEALIVAAAAMHREEMGVDPLAIDPASWRTRMTTLVDRGWSWVWVEAGEVVFKTELSAWTPDVAQLQGVYVAPSHRRRGIGRAGLAAVAADVLADVPVCSLYVNHYNAAGLALYAALGFRHSGDFATVIF